MYSFIYLDEISHFSSIDERIPFVLPIAATIRGHLWVTQAGSTRNRGRSEPTRHVGKQYEQLLG
jgi:hypothetical protein